VQAKEVRRAQLARETLGYLCLPGLYVALMAAGVFAYSPTLALVSLALVVMLILQLRSTAIAGAMVRAAPRAAARPLPQEALDQADLRFLRHVNYGLLATVAAYLALLWGIDSHVRTLARGEPPGLALAVGAAAAFAIILAGREAARRAAWSGFKERFPELWAAKEGLDRGRATRSPAAFFEWRVAAERADD
jgi:hypothetical protein